MWNLIMDTWMITSFLGMMFPAYQATKRKYMTWREFWFFIFGVYIASIPFIYLINR